MCTKMYGYTFATIYKIIIISCYIHILLENIGFDFFGAYIYLARKNRIQCFRASLCVGRWFSTRHFSYDNILYNWYCRVNLKTQKKTKTEFQNRQSNEKKVCIPKYELFTHRKRLIGPNA